MNDKGPPTTATAAASIASTSAPARTAVQVAASVRAGRLRARDVLEEHLDRIDRRNAALNALVAVRADAARRDADAVDQIVRAGGDPGPLAGVPFTAKDILATADLRTTCGSRALAEHRPDADAEAIRRVRAAGAVLVGKTNTPEFAFGVHTINHLYGATRHPHAETTVGGSSGGEAAAVAAGFSTFGLGTDFGGSLRWPGLCTSTIGLRPEVGTVPTYGVLPSPVEGHPSLQDAVQVIGPVTRTVADAQLVLNMLTGALTGTASFPHPPADLSHLTLLWGAGPGGTRASEQYTAVADLAEALSRTGVHATEGLPALLEEACEVYDELRAGEDHTALRALVGDRVDLVEPRNRRHLQPTPLLSDTSSACQRRELLLAELDDVLGTHTLLALPVATREPRHPEVDTLEDFDLLKPCRAVSLFGLTALSVPWGYTRAGAPVSVQLVAPRGRTQLVLDVAAHLVETHSQTGVVS